MHTRPVRRVGFVAAALLLLGVVSVSTGTASAAPTALAEQTPPPTYANPVITAEGRQPFVLQHEGTYYAYTTGYDSPTMRKVPALMSTDLVTWTSIGDVLSTVGPWASTSSGTRFTSPSVRHIPGNPADARFVLYYTGVKPDANLTKCIGVAKASSPAGPFTSVGTSPLICPDGGAKDASPVPPPGEGQLVYKANQPVPGIYRQVLSANGMAISSSSPNPLRIMKAFDGWWQENVLDRPAIAFAPDGSAYLFFRGGLESTGTGWSPCQTSGGTITGCHYRSHFGTWISGTSSVSAPSGVQVFSDTAGAQWVVYSALPGGACTPTCTGTRTPRIDKLCFAHGQPRTNGPSTGAQSSARDADCSTDIPGAALNVSSVEDNIVLSQHSQIAFRDGGASMPVQGRLLWTFSDSVVIGSCGGNGLLSNTANYGIPHASATNPGYGVPTLTSSPHGTCPNQFIPFTQAEIDFNNFHRWVGTGQRIALWENGGIELPDGTALVTFVKLIHDHDTDGSGPDTGCGICYTYQGQGTAKVTLGATTVDRSPSASPAACNPNCLFGPSDDEFYGRPFVDGGYVYMYSNTPGGLFDPPNVRLGRVPFASYQTRSAWQFRTSSGGWSSSISAAAHQATLDRAAPMPAYNAHLDAFVDVSPLASGNGLGIQTAPDPWGPWSNQVTAFNWTSMKCPQGGMPYGGIQAPAVDTRNSRTIRFTYARPGNGFGNDPACPGQVRLAGLRIG